MIKAIIFDFSRVLLRIKDQSYLGSLNRRHSELKQTQGYSLFDNFELNEELIEFITSLTDKYDLYIFTTGYLHNEPEIFERISPSFKNMFNIEDIGFHKTDPRSFEKLANLIEVAPNEILFIDDTKENITAAKIAGLHTIHFLNNNALFKGIKKILKV